MPYSHLFYHFVWTTKDRQPLITEANRTPILKAIAAKTIQLNGICHAVNAVSDHVHLVATVPPSIALGIFIGQVKGNSSHLASRLGGDGALQAFAWQSEYGVMTVSESLLTTVVLYVLNQQEHHDAGDVNARLGQWE